MELLSALVWFKNEVAVPSTPPWLRKCGNLTAVTAHHEATAAVSIPTSATWQARPVAYFELRVEAAPACDGCAPPPPVVVANTVSLRLPVGDNRVNFTAIARRGRPDELSSSCEFHVLVRDTEPPNIVACPADQLRLAGRAGLHTTGGQLAAALAAQATDNVRVAATWFATEPAGGPADPLALPLGAHDLVFRAVDTSGNRDRRTPPCTVDVHVATVPDDTLAPTPAARALLDGLQPVAPGSNGSAPVPRPSVLLQLDLLQGQPTKVPLLTNECEQLYGSKLGWAATVLAGTLPLGLSINTAGLEAVGAPLLAQDLALVVVRVCATALDPATSCDVLGLAVQVRAYQVTLAPVVLLPAVLGVNYSFTPELVRNATVGGTNFTTFRQISGGLPTGLAVTAAGQVHGVPRQLGPQFAFGLEARDASGVVAAVNDGQAFSLAVRECGLGSCGAHGRCDPADPDPYDGKFRCVCAKGYTGDRCDSRAAGPDQAAVVGKIAAATLGALLVVVATASVLYVRRQRRAQKQNRQLLQTMRARAGRRVSKQLGRKLDTDAVMRTLEIPRHDVRLDHELGRGEYGVVARGRLRRTTTVAVKQLVAGASDTDKEHFLIEAWITGALVHPHIIRILGVVVG